MTDKRPGPPAGGPAKRSKHHGGAPLKAAIHAGDTGFLVSAVTGFETKAGKEAVTALRTVYENLTKRAATPSPPPTTTSGAGAALDADLAALAAEDADRAATLKAGGLRVTQLGTGVMWVTARGAPGDPPPSTIAVALARGIAAGDTDTPRTKHVLRVTPFDAVAAATLEKICEGMRPLVAAAFPEGSPSLSTAVQYDHRASPGSPGRDELTAAVAALVPEGHTVDLKNPDRALVVHALRGVAGLAVVPDYRALARLNLRELAAPGATAAAAAAAAARNAADREQVAGRGKEGEVEKGKEGEAKEGKEGEAKEEGGGGVKQEAADKEG